MKVRLQTVCSFSGETEEEDKEVLGFEGDAIRDIYNRELIEMGAPVKGLMRNLFWTVSADGNTAAFVLETGPNSFLTGVARKII